MFVSDSGVSPPYKVSHVHGAISHAMHTALVDRIFELSCLPEAFAQTPHGGGVLPDLLFRFLVDRSRRAVNMSLTSKAAQSISFRSDNAPPS
jgi:hypothetical protein